MFILEKGYNMFEKLVLDLSHWQGDIDFFKIKQSGVWGVILKCGGAENGKYYMDKNFLKYYNLAKTNNLHVGAYWFTGMKFNAVEEAKQFTQWMDGMCFDLPVYIDFEVSTPKLKRENTQYVIDFLEELTRTKHFCGIYASDISGFQDRLNAPLLLPYTWWVARYSADFPKYAKMNCHIWQFTSKGRILGVPGNVDCSWCYRDFPTIIISGHYNGY